VTRKHVAWPLPNLTTPAVQDVGIHLQRPRHLAYRVATPRGYLAAEFGLTAVRRQLMAPQSTTIVPTR
jgi:hypothetical protein